MFEKIQELLAEKKISAVQAMLRQEKAVDTADILENLSDEFLPLAFRILPKDTAADVFAYMDSETQQKLIRSFSDSELKEVINDLYVDDAVDMIEEMPSNVVKRILRSANLEMRKSINMLLQYPKNSAGSIMTTEYVSLKRDMTVEDAFMRIRENGVDKETIYTAYIISENRKLIGTVSAKALLLSPMKSLIGDIMDTNFKCVATAEDQESVAELFMKYDLLALPVVDAESRLVGIVTVDDAIDVLKDEATEDMEAMAAIVPTDKPYMKTGVIETWLKRIPWLLILMISATFTGGIIRNYENALQNGYVILTAFIPMLDTMIALPENMRKAAAGGFINATDCADYLVGKGLPFRDAYKATGELVALCINKGTTLEQLPLEEYKNICDLFDEGVYKAIDLDKCVNDRTSLGGPAPKNVLAQVKRIRELNK